MSVSLSVEDALGIVLIDRQDKLNALDLISFQEIERIMDIVRRDDKVGGLIFTAAGTRAFSAGADIADLKDIGADEAPKRATYRRGVFQELSELPIPTVAVVDGLAMGGGVELALACTFRLATARSSFSFPEIRLGLLPGAGGTQRLPRLIGEVRALEMMLTARRINADEALRIGLVDRIVENPLEDAKNFASQWTQFSRAAVREILAAIQCSELPIREGLEMEGEHLSFLNTSADAAEGIAAFFEKRTPIFNQKR
jgi:enoyl-CoA hydratase